MARESEALVLDDEQIADALIQLDGWELKGKQICKTYTFKAFSESMEFTNAVAETAERLNHHPDIHIAYKKVKILAWTHKFNAVTQADVELAHAVEEVYVGR